jgi:hypothetical protein
MFLTSTWFFEWNPPPGSEPVPRQDVHGVAPVPPQPLHTAIIVLLDVPPPPPSPADDTAREGMEMRGATAAALS